MAPLSMAKGSHWVSKVHRPVLMISHGKTATVLCIADGYDGSHIVLKGTLIYTIMVSYWYHNGIERHIWMTHKYRIYGLAQAPGNRSGFAGEGTQRSGGG